MNRVLVRPVGQTVPLWSNRLMSDPFSSEVFNWFFGEPQAKTNSNGKTAPATFRVNVYQDENNFYVYALLPNADASKFDITTLENKLTIAGEITEQSYAPQGEGVQPLYRELADRKAVKFERSFELPFAIDADNVTANYENSVLTLTLPKVPQAKARHISLANTESNPELTTSK